MQALYQRLAAAKHQFWKNQEPLSDPMANERMKATNQELEFLINAIELILDSKGDVIANGMLEKLDELARR